MADKLMIILANTDPANPSELGAPFLQATVAAAMDFDVEVIFTGRAGELAIRGVADKLYVQKSTDKTVYELIKNACEAGAVFKICTTTLDMWGDDVIPEVIETVGDAYLISEAMDDDTVTFTY